MNFFALPEILWLHSDKAGCGSYRCYTPALGLEQQWDHNFLLASNVIADVPREWQKELDPMAVVIFQRTHNAIASMMMKYCARQGIKVVYEMDDDLWHVPKHNPSFPTFSDKRVQRALEENIMLSDAVIVSTDPLREMVVERTGHNHVHVCLNHMSPHVWGPENFNPLDRVDNRPFTVIGWQGSHTHDVDFKEALPAIRRVMAENPLVICRFFGHVPLSVQGQIPPNRFQWSKGVPFEAYVKNLYHKNFDINLAPIVDNYFNRSKSNIKVVESAMFGVPSVASKVYPYARTIDHGRTGFLASTEEEWYVALTTLVRDAELRQQMGATARAEWVTEWGPRHAQSWHKVFKSLVTHAQPATA